MRGYPPCFQANQVALYRRAQAGRRMLVFTPGAWSVWGKNDVSGPGRERGGERYLIRIKNRVFFTFWCLFGHF